MGRLCLVVDLSQEGSVTSGPLHLFSSCCFTSGSLEVMTMSANCIDYEYQVTEGSAS